MTKEKEEKISFKEAIKLSIRGYKIWWRENPAIFISTFCHRAVLAITPYVAIFFTAQIIEEIVGSQDRIVLRNLVLMALISALILGLLIAGLGRWQNIQRSDPRLRRMHEKLLNDKLLHMDFISADSHRIKDLYSQIKQNAGFAQYGLLQLLHFFEHIVSALVSIGGAIVLTLSFFAATVAYDAPSANLLNHPLFTMFIFIMMIIVTFLSPALFTKSSARRMRYTEDYKLMNRFYSILFQMDDPSRHIDIRMYRQDKITSSSLMLTFSKEAKDIAYGPIAILDASAVAISQLFTGIVYFFVGLKAWAGAFGVGQMTQYIGAITALSQGVSFLLGELGRLVQNAHFLQMTFEFLDEPNHMYQGSLTVEKREDNKYEIEFRNVSFKYPTVEIYALKNVSVKFKMGERLAIVGENGSGKTTFIKLLARLYDPTEGEILLNGIDIRKYDYYEYMDIFSVVFQDFQLLAFELGENVAAGVEYDEARVTECLEGTGFGERLASLEQGLRTRLYKGFDEQGIDVSGGEAQKIALARALYKDAAFIILDEPTAALDPIAEHEVYSRMNEITQGKTAIFISHRLSSCRFCQDIVVFHEGELIQQGSHDMLVSDDAGKYHELWHAQAQYYIE